ncbi:MAG: alpha/beta hydrolase [Desulfobacteraceae bacterium]|nr:MAG: alpha/beta hydrolase [Desulfobacteraceae bacterium]
MNISGNPDPQADQFVERACGDDDGVLKPLVQKTGVPWKKRFSIAAKSLRKGADAGVGILNGIVGDYLHQQNNPLAVCMEFYTQGRPLTLTPEALKTAFPNMTSRICVLVHGLVCDETIWKYNESPETTYGSALQEDLGYTPFYVRYNTGRHISENGRNLSELMEKLVAALPVRINEIVFITHSMGGLVTRSACYYGLQHEAEWVKNVRKLFYLGAPHLGAPLEKFGNAAAFVLKKFPRPYIKIIGDVINVRSSGIKDLRYGYVADEDWAGHDPDVFLKNTKNSLPLMDGVSHYVITGRLTENPRHPVSRLFGDALVRTPSALGRSPHKKHYLDFPPEHHREYPATGHMKLTHCPEVYAQIRQWCE